MYIHSSRNVSCDKSTASSKAISPQSSIYCFLFQISICFLSLWPSSNCLRHLPRLLVFSIFPSVTSFGRQELTNPVGLHSFYCTYSVYIEIIFLQSQVDAAVTLLTCFREVPSSNLRTKHLPS